MRFLPGWRPTQWRIVCCACGPWGPCTLCMLAALVLLLLLLLVVLMHVGVQIKTHVQVHAWL